MDTDISLKKRIFFVCIVICLTVVVLEGLVRVFLSHKTVEPVVPASLGQFDPMLGWSLKPLSSGISRRTGYEIEYQINSKGLRDDETDYKKPTGLFRIVLLGDSRTFGFGVPIEKHFSILLEGYFKDVEVINMGISGFGVDQELLYLQSEGFRYEPDLVIAYVAHYGDQRHMHEERWRKKKPRFVLIDGQLILTNSPLAPPQSSHVLRKLHYGISKYSMAYHMFSTYLLSRIRPPSTNQQKQQDKENLQDEEFRRTLHELGERLVYAMDEASLNHGATFVLITHIPELYEAALEKELFALNLSKALSNDKFRLPNNLKHINECGNGVVAWEIAQFLQDNQLIPPKHLKARHSNSH